MGNNLKMEVVETIRVLKRRSWSIRKISRETGCNRAAIRRVIETEANNEIPQGGTFSSAPRVDPDPASPISKSKAEPYKNYIENQVELGVDAKTIFHRLKFEHGFSGSYYSIKRYVRNLKRTAPRMIGRMVALPGEEAQIDFGRGAPILDTNNGSERRPHLFKMVLSCSRHSYEEVVWHQNTETFIQCHINAFNSFGGIPSIVRLDNLKAGIKECCWYDAVENPLYAEFARHYGFVILACKPGTPEHKGKVENGIGYTQRAVHGKKFKSLSEENQYLRWWNEHVARVRIHGSTQRQVWAMFEQVEKPALKPLPLQPFELFSAAPRRVHFDGYIMVDYSFYSMPREYLCAEVEARWDQKFVKIYYRHQLIRMHEKSHERGARVTVDGDIPEYLLPRQEHYRDYLKDKLRKIGTEVAAWSDYLFQERGPQAFRVLQGVLSLRKKHTDEVISDACRQAISSHIITYPGIEQLCRQKTFQQKYQPSLFAATHEFVRLPAEYQDLTEEWNSQTSPRQPNNELNGGGIQ